MRINDDTGLNTILLSPVDFSSFNTFSRIIFLDPVVNMGYLSELQKYAKSTIYLPHAAGNANYVLKNIDLSRDEFGKYYRLIQFAYENKISGQYTYNLYQNIISKIKDKNSYNYLQFVVCLDVFKELKIIETDDDKTITRLNANIKSQLNASAFYNRLNALKQAE